MGREERKPEYERKKKQKHGEKKNKKEEEKGGRKKGKRRKGKRKRKECRTVSKPGWRRTRNYATRGRIPSTPVHFTPRGRVRA